MDLTTFLALLTPSGQEVLQAATARHPDETNFLAHFQTLSKRFPPELARAALEIAILQREAVKKFPFAEKLYLTRSALEQASPWEVAIYRAERYRGFSCIADLGCSIGGDTLALAQVAPTIGLDCDSLRLAMAQANALSLGSPAEFLLADLTSRLPLSPTPQLALFFDPSRREMGRRLFSVQQYRPPLEIIRDWLPHYPAVGVKVSPGVHLNELQSYDCEVEFISLRGELKEAALWFGPLKTVKRRATVLPGPHMLTPEGPEPTLPLDEPRGFLYEPDPAVIRAGLVRTLGARLNAAQLDPQIAYLTSDQKIETPFARLWEVEDWMPFGLKKLRHNLRERNIGRVTVKKRGSAIQPEFLIRKLKLQGDLVRVLFLTQLRGRPIVVICY